MSKFIDLTGEKFGKLTALELDKERSDNKNKIWKCQCECGNVVFFFFLHLRNGNTTSCGCIKIKNLEGKRFGKLTVLERAEDKTQKNGKRLIMWRCKCDCGNETIVPSSRLTSGNTKSCGCGSSRYLRKTHGKSETRLYRVWRGVKSRCYNPNSTGYITHNVAYNTRGWVVDQALFEFSGNSWGSPANAVDIALLSGTTSGVPYDNISQLQSNNANANISDQR